MPAINPDIPLEQLYRTSSLLEGFAQIPSAPTFLRDRSFQPRLEETETDMVEIEFYRGRKSSHHFAARYSKGTAVPREKTRLSMFSPPFLKPNRMLHADDLLRRGVGTALARGDQSRRGVARPRSAGVRRQHLAHGKLDVQRKFSSPARSLPR